MVRNKGEDLHNPDFSGAEGRAWNVNVADVPPQFATVLGLWLIEAPFARQEYNSHLAMLMQLKDVPGAPPVEYKRAGATHEFGLGRLDPALEDTADPADPRSLKILGLPDRVEQLIFPSDRRALEVVSLAVQNCVDGVLNLNEVGHQNWVDFLLFHE